MAWIFRVAIGIASAKSSPTMISQPRRFCHRPFCWRSIGWVAAKQNGLPDLLGGHKTKDKRLGEAHACCCERLRHCANPSKATAPTRKPICEGSGVEVLPPTNPTVVNGVAEFADPPSAATKVPAGR